jgi:hypothetical protein
MKIYAITMIFSLNPNERLASCKYQAMMLVSILVPTSTPLALIGCELSVSLHDTVIAGWMFDSTQVIYAIYHPDYHTANECIDVVRDAEHGNSYLVMPPNQRSDILMTSP